MLIKKIKNERKRFGKQKTKELLIAQQVEKEITINYKLNKSRIIHFNLKKIKALGTKIAKDFSFQKDKAKFYTSTWIRRFCRTYNLAKFILPNYYIKNLTETVLTLRY